MSTTTEPTAADWAAHQADCDKATELTFEIVPSDLALPPEEKQSLIQSFSPLLAKAKELLEESKGITSAKLARVSRLQFRKLRSESNTLRETTNAHHLRMQRAVNGAHAILVAAVQGEEERMEAIEKAEERREEERIEAIRQARHDLLVPLGVHESIANSPGLGRMAEDAWLGLFNDSKAMHEARLERERKEAEEALARQVAEAQAREKIRLENERLLKEAAEREEAARIEREKAAAEKAALEEQARLEREAAAAAQKALEDKLAKERAEAEAKLAAERAEAEKKAEYERQAAQARQDEADKRAKAERDALEAKSRFAQAAQEAKLAEAKRLHDELVEKQRLATEAENKRIEAEEAKKREAEEAAEAALLAPDKDKLLAVALAVRGILLPKVKAKKAITALAQFQTKIQNLADWIEEKAGEL